MSMWNVFEFMFDVFSVHAVWIELYRECIFIISKNCEVVNVSNAMCYVVSTESAKCCTDKETCEHVIIVGLEMVLKWWAMQCEYCQIHMHRWLNEQWTNVPFKFCLPWPCNRGNCAEHHNWRTKKKPESVKKMLQLNNWISPKKVHWVYHKTIIPHSGFRWKWMEIALLND